MFRKPAVAAGVLLLAVSTRMHALGLGEIDVRSALNEPFDAQVTLTSASNEQLETLRVSIASSEAFARAGIPRTAILREFEFAVERSGDGKPVIRISTDDPIREPFMDFLLEAAWPSGRMLKQYTILVDPPYTMPAAPPAPVAAVTPAPRAQVAVTPAPAPGRQPVTAPSTAPARVTATPGPAPSTYGPVKRNDTLWKIASQVRPGSDISMEQMMLALQRANPDAFAGNNINNLQRGAVLQVPSREEILTQSAAEARAETRRQNQRQRSRLHLQLSPSPSPVCSWSRRTRSWSRVPRYRVRPVMLLRPGPAKKPLRLLPPRRPCVRNSHWPMKKPRRVGPRPVNSSHGSANLSPS